VDKSARLLIAAGWFDGVNSGNRESEGKSGGIPHLAKNERDVGHPSRCEGTRGEIPWKGCTEFLIDGFGLIQGWEGRPDVFYTRRIRLWTPQQHGFKSVAYQQ